MRLGFRRYALAVFMRAFGTASRAAVRLSRRGSYV